MAASVQHDVTIQSSKNPSALPSNAEHESPAVRACRLALAAARTRKDCTMPPRIFEVTEIDDDCDHVVTVKVQYSEAGYQSYGLHRNGEIRYWPNWWP